MRLGLGTGSTVAVFLPLLAGAVKAGLDIVAVPTSEATGRLAGTLGIPLGDLDALAPLDLAIDGADEIDPRLNLIKGGGGAHLREKIVAAAAARFVVIADSSKTVDRIEPPIPLELSRFGLAATLARIESQIGEVAVREGAAPSPDDGVIADYRGAVEDPAELAVRLAAMPGIVDHGLFPPELVSDVIVGGTDD